MELYQNTDIVPLDLVDVFTPAPAGSLMRSCQVMGLGNFRLSRRTCELYSIMIIGSGAWGRITLRNGKGRPLWFQPSTFTGSFVIGGEAEDGLIVELHATIRPNVTVNWREPDQEIF